MESIEGVVMLCTGFGGGGSSIGCSGNSIPFYGLGPGSPDYGQPYRVNPVSPVSNEQAVIIQQNYIGKKEPRYLTLERLEESRQFEFNSFSLECGCLKINSINFMKNERKRSLSLKLPWEDKP